MQDSESDEMLEIQVPTHDSRIRNWLRVLGEPMTLFGEDSLLRKQRLQQILNNLESDDLNELNFDSEVEGQEFYSVGANDLKHARKSILDYSIKAAKLRIQKQLLELDVPFASRKKIRHDFYSNLFKFETKSVQNGDERPLGYCKFSPNSKLLGISSWSGEFRLWSVEDSKLQKSFKGHADRLSAFDFHPQATIGQPESSVNIATAGQIINRNGR